MAYPPPHSLSTPRPIPNHLDVLRVLSFSDSDHPQEFVDVISGVTDHTSKDNEDVIHAQHPHYGVGLLLRGGHGFAHQRYVTIVPGVVVHKGGPIRHTWTRGGGRRGQRRRERGGRIRQQYGRGRERERERERKEGWPRIEEGPRGIVVRANITKGKVRVNIRVEQYKREGKGQHQS